ncbi:MULTISPECIES: 2-isopropylmalate synthase [unclassified Campylobacter]|uniref:2-isopropylmalate synthase n=1 Tax=unclassified Campylobacter TaxID=2593542 RepID=UPI001237F3D9|nr:MULTISPECIES: 2-isopropylmalate synthase [unclassified Campylobacter]KAA6225497.1 2-isopropylmalate synthase [Campylobacter sp. LR196d]KAA6227435.1 2-isopropylmalate synthase [Campylobacter sp. LR185c]KAA6229768.1 2-isopropylmalate synthase [Campylobacter sp. LR286c]KAA6234293.1 2-isopropylmalate synthase [Campylobacter sp. LR291e]KAA8604097.1 2-isopropylmalate synthase [Campylobacter sp. LR185c]
MKDNKQVIIFDTTLRDGEQALSQSLNINQKLQIALALENLGVDIIEAGFPVSSPGDFESVQSIAKNVKNSVVCGLSRAVNKDIDACYEALKVAKRFRIHTFIATSTLHVKDKLKKDFNEVVNMAKNAVMRARNYTEDVEFSCEDAGRTPIDDLCRMVEVAINAGAKTINIPDTVGYTLPYEFGDIIKTLFNRVPNIDKAVISVHCHNDLGMATGNSLSAIMQGARQIECAMNGLGERAGNCALEEVVMAIKTRSKLFNGLYTNIIHENIAKTSKLVAAICNEPVPSHKAIVGSNAFSHSSGIHQDGVIKNRQTYEIITPESIGLNENRMLLTARSGRNMIKTCLENLGYAENTYDLDDIYESFLKLADKKGQVYDYDLEALMFLSQELQEKPRFVLENLNVISGGENVIPTACVQLNIDGCSKTMADIGNGPVEAVFNCLIKLVEIDCKLLNYVIGAKGSGVDAQGQVDVVMEFQGRKFHGMGLSTDVIEASTQAFINTFNAIAKAMQIEVVKRKNAV